MVVCYCCFFRNHTHTPLHTVNPVYTILKCLKTLSNVLSIFEVWGKLYRMCFNRRTTRDDNTENAAGNLLSLYNHTKLLESKTVHQIQACVAFSVYDTLHAGCFSQQNSGFRSNVLGTKFTVYDGGENPERKPFVQECESVRQELAAVCYVSETRA